MENVIQEIKDRIEKAGSQGAAARSLGISPSLLSEILSGRRNISRTLLKKLGFVEIKVYVKKVDAFKIGGRIREILDANENH